MDFCFCLSGHIRTKHSINSVPYHFPVFTNISHLETKTKFLRDRAGNFGTKHEHPYFGGTNFPSPLPPVISSHYVYSMVGSGGGKSSLGINNQTPLRLPRRHGQPTGTDSTCSPAGFSRPTNVKTVSRIQVYFFKQRSFF